MNHGMAVIGAGKMIKIDWRRILYDHVWFGHYVDCHPYTEWNRNDWSVRPKEWKDRLWPVRRYGVPPPTWWHIMWDMKLERDEDGNLLDD
jgi:hypothetical protein